MTEKDRTPSIDEGKRPAGGPAEPPVPHASTKLPKATIPTTPLKKKDSYRALADGLFLEKFVKGTRYLQQLTNFTATITRQLIATDGVDSERRFEIDARVGNTQSRFTLGAEEFDAMNWPFVHIGAVAVVAAGFGLRQHARAAIQVLSGADIPTEVVFTHLGWTKIDNQWLYLHAGGAIGTQSGVATSTVQTSESPTQSLDMGHVSLANLDYRPDQKSMIDNTLPSPGSQGSILKEQRHEPNVTLRLPQALSLYRLPAPPSDGDLIAAIRACIDLIQVAPDHVILPLIATTWRSPIGTTDYGVHVVGQTGVGKTELLALLLQHFGPEMDSRHVPAGWSSTANALESLAFHAKDTIFAVDDFVLRGSRSDIERAHRDADRLLRAQGNSSGRTRCQANGKPREGKPPRGTIISTGEHVYSGHSLNARVLNLHVKGGDIDWVKLTNLQAIGRNGTFAQAMAGFIQWLAPRLEKIRVETREQADVLRDVFKEDCRHQRTASIAGELLAGLEVFLEFALDKSAIDQSFFDSLWKRYHVAIRVVIQEQNHQQDSEDPVERFLGFLAAALLGGYANVAGIDGGPPPSNYASYKAWGWEERGFPVPSNRRKIHADAPDSATEERDDEHDMEYRCFPKGKRIGWLFVGELYLQPAMALAVAEGVARACGQTLPFTERTLGKALADKKLLLSRDERRGRYTRRKNVEGQRTYVYVLDQNSVLSPEWRSVDCLEPGHEGPECEELIA